MPLRNAPLFCAFLLLLTGATAHAITIKSITFATKDAGKVTFDHSQHLQQEGINNNCKVCHDAVFNIGKKVRHTMADMEKGKSCGACHGKSAFSLTECGRCHNTKDVSFTIKYAGTVLFSHDLHTKHFTCNKCHSTLYGYGRANKAITMADMEKGKSCGACHDEKSAFSVTANCAVCHKTQ